MTDAQGNVFFEVRKLSKDTREKEIGGGSEESGEGRPIRELKLDLDKI